MGVESGHIIATTIGGRNGQPKQVYLYCVHSENSLGHNQESKWIVSLWKIFPLVYFPFIDLIDHQLHYGTCGWNRVFWRCLSGHNWFLCRMHVGYHVNILGINIKGYKKCKWKNGYMQYIVKIGVFLIWEGILGRG